MKGQNPVMRETQRGERLGVALLDRRIDFPDANAQPERLQIDEIEFSRIANEGGVAARDNLRDDRANHLVDILRDFPLHCEKRVERSGKIRAPRIKPQGHQVTSSKCVPA